MLASKTPKRIINYSVGELRDFEQEIADIFQSAKIHGPVHLSYGNETQLIDIFQYIDPNDWVFSTWRNHYHALLHGVPKEELKAQILAGHSISFQSPEHHFYTSAIVNGILPIAVGTALGIKWQNDVSFDWAEKQCEKGFLPTVRPDRREVWVFIGDMTSESGVFYEAIKYSFRNKLPIHFIIEDNGLSTNTPTQESWGKKQYFVDFPAMVAYNYPQYVTYYKYERSKYPHQGTGQWVNF